MTALFRKEWGCQTISFTTDFYAGLKAASPLDMLVRAGTDNVTPASMSGTWDAERKTVVLADGSVSDAQWFTTRECAKVFLWVHANTAMNMNDVDFSAWTVDELVADQGVAAQLNVQAPVEANKVEYVLRSGALPAGLTLNADGTITGTNTGKAGTYSFTVQARADNWVTANRQVNMVVNSAFRLDETEAYVDEEFYAEITSENVNANVYSDGIVYSVVAGQLPAGLTLSENGEIEGTPEEAGEYTFTVRPSTNLQSAPIGGYNKQENAPALSNR